MFKSVFTKYVTAFMIMIGISFSLLAIILSQMVSGYAQDSKSRVIERTSETLTDFITSQYREAGGDFNQFIYFDRDSVEPFISALANFNEDISVILTDANGAVLLTAVSGASGFVGSNVSADVMSEVSFGGETTFSGDLGGVFSSKQMIHVSPITDGDGSFTGAVFVCTPSKATDQLIVSMIKTIIMASLWVMLAALISVYMISDKIITPLKEMSRAAKSFASGKFDVRVPVRGRDEVAELATGFNSMAAPHLPRQRVARPENAYDDDIRLHRRHPRRRDTSGEARVLPRDNPHRDKASVAPRHKPARHNEDTGGRAQVQQDRVRYL